MGFLPTKKDPFADLQKQVAKNPKDTRALLELAALFLKKNDKSGSVDHYILAAKAFYDDKQLNKANAAAKQALAVNSKSIEAYEFLAGSYEAANLKEDQRTMLKKLVDLYFETGDQSAVARARERLSKLGPGR